MTTGISRLNAGATTKRGVREPKALRLQLERIERNLAVNQFLEREAKEAEQRRKAREAQQVESDVA